MASPTLFDFAQIWSLKDWPEGATRAIAEATARTAQSEWIIPNLRIRQGSGETFTIVVDTLTFTLTTHNITATTVNITADVVNFGNDVCLLRGDGAPTDGTTGDNVAGPGSLYVDYTNGNLYIQTAVKTSPVWKLVTRAA